MMCKHVLQVKVLKRSPYLTPLIVCTTVSATFVSGTFFVFLLISIVLSMSLVIYALSQRGLLLVLRLRCLSDS